MTGKEFNPGRTIKMNRSFGSLLRAGTTYEVASCFYSRTRGGFVAELVSSSGMHRVSIKRTTLAKLMNSCHLSPVHTR